MEGEMESETESEPEGDVERRTGKQTPLPAKKKEMTTTTLI